MNTDKLLEKDMAKQRISKSEAEAARARLKGTTDMSALSDADFVIEAVPVRIFTEMGASPRIETFNLIFIQELTH